MANRNAPFGARPVMHQNGTPWNGHTQLFEFPSGDSTVVFVGDFVKLYDTPTDKYPAATAATATHLITGVVVAFKPDPANIAATTMHKAASTQRFGYVVTDPTVIYEIQEDSDGGAMVIGNIGSNGDIVATAGNTTTGTSAMVLDSSDVISKDASAATAQLRVVGKVNDGQNAIGNYCKWLVRINEHQFANTSVGI